MIYFSFSFNLICKKQCVLNVLKKIQKMENLKCVYCSLSMCYSMLKLVYKKITLVQI